MNELKELLKEHLGHRVKIAEYGRQENFALEDLTTNEIIFDTDVYDLIAVDDEDEDESRPPIADMSSSDIFTQLTDTQKDDIYRMVWYTHTANDVESFLANDFNGEIPTDEDDLEALIEDVCNAFVYNGEYDCNLSYWQNIENLVRDYI